MCVCVCANVLSHTCVVLLVHEDVTLRAFAGNMLLESVVLVRV